MDESETSQRAGESPQGSDKYATMEKNNHALLISFFPDEPPLVKFAAREEFSAVQGVEVLNPVIRIITRPAPNGRHDESSGRL
jgi:hypothetical protein